MSAGSLFRHILPAAAVPGQCCGCRGNRLEDEKEESNMQARGQLMVERRLIERRLTIIRGKFDEIEAAARGEIREENDEGIGDQWKPSQG
jgi:hypothetical protein